MPDQSRRHSRSHNAIMAAAQELLREKGYMDVTIEAIAARAGAGKQTIYRWWSGKAALYLDLYQELIPPSLLDVNKGSVRADLEALLTQLFARYRDTGIDAALCGLIAEMGRDNAHADVMRAQFVQGRRPILTQILERAVARGELPKGSNPSFLSDLITGAIWFRLLLGHAPMDQEFIHELTASILPETSDAS